MFSYLLMESSFKSILTRAEVRDHHLPFPGASSHGTKRGGRGRPTSEGCVLSGFLNPRVFVFCFGPFSLRVGRWLMSAFYFVLFNLLGRSGFLLLLWEAMTNLNANGIRSTFKSLGWLSLSPNALQVILDSEGLWARKKKAARLHHVTQPQLSSGSWAEAKLPLRRSVRAGMVPEAV